MRISRCRAAAPGAGDVNGPSDYVNCAFGAGFDDFYLGGTPWDLPELYIEKSPLFRAKMITTPTIIFFGADGQQRNGYEVVGYMKAEAFADHVQKAFAAAPVTASTAR